MTSGTAFRAAGVTALFVLASAVLAQPATRCDNCGTIADIRQTTEKSTWTPLGSATPGTVPGDYGSNSGRVTAAYQIGPQMRNQGMVLLGSAGGGAYAKRPNAYDQPRWDLSVKMDAGGVRNVSISYEPPFRPGDRVRVYGTQLELIQP